MPQTPDFVRQPSQYFRGFPRALALVVVATLLVSCERPPVNRSPPAPLTTVQSVDLERYLGRWYEIARLPNEFEVDCVGVTATYSRNTDGTVKVVNRCRKGKLDGPEDITDGTATVVDTTTNAKLSVTFFWPFAGDYWVIDLADDYSWALVGEPSGRYLWILARAPTISADTHRQLVEKLTAKGYNTAALYWTPQAAN